MYANICVCLRICFLLIVSAPDVSTLGALFFNKKVWKYQRKIVNLYHKINSYGESSKTTNRQWCL
jgi:hypothetical protein